MDTLTGIVTGIVIATIIAHVINQRVRATLRIGRITSLDVETKNILDRIVFRTLADRALVLKYHNGSILTVGGDKYISVLFESHTENVQGVKTDFQRYKIDAAYTQMINTLMNEGRIVTEVNKLPDGFLKRQYERDGIAATVIFKIVATPNVLYFGSMSTTKPFSDFVGSHEYSILEIEINRVRNLYEAAKKHKILH